MRLCCLQEKWTELEIIMLSEISQTEKDKYHMFSFTWNLHPKKQKRKKRNDMNVKQGDRYTEIPQ
jgi:hypothetical protein